MRTHPAIPIPIPPAHRITRSLSAREPYRDVCKEIEEAMTKTIETINAQFSDDGTTLIATSMPELPIESTAQVLDKLLLLHRYDD